MALWWQCKKRVLWRDAATRAHASVSWGREPDLRCLAWEEVGPRGLLGGIMWHQQEGCWEEGPLHRKSGTRGQSSAAAEGRYRVDQISSLHKTLQWPHAAIRVKSKNLMFVIWPLLMSAIVSWTNIHGFYQLVAILTFFLFSHAIFFSASKCLCKLCLMPEMFLHLAFF